MTCMTCTNYSSWSEWNVGWQSCDHNLLFLSLPSWSWCEIFMCHDWIHVWNVSIWHILSVIEHNDVRTVAQSQSNKFKVQPMLGMAVLLHPSQIASTIVRLYVQADWVSRSQTTSKELTRELTYQPFVTEPSRPKWACFDMIPRVSRSNIIIHI